MTAPLTKAGASVLFVLLVVAGPSAAQRATPSDPVELTETEWRAIRSQITYPRPNMRSRKELAYLTLTPGSARLSATVETMHYEETADYRRYYRTGCAMDQAGWKCRPPADIFEFEAHDPRTVVVGEGVTSAEVLEIDRFLNEHPLSGWKRRHRLLVSVTLRELRVSSGEYRARVASDVDSLCGARLRIRRGENGDLAVTDVPSVFCA
jgi:hypothetical protein